jgi:rod shape-determining protein MreC
MAIALMVTDHYQNHLEQVRAVLSLAVYPIHYGVDLPVKATRWVAENTSSHQRLLNENAKLREQNFLLRSHLQKLTALETENLRLRELLDSSLKLTERVLVADLLAVELESYNRRIVLNKGSVHGVFIGQPIVDSNGVMGQVIHVGPLTSTAMLITDPSHTLPVQVNRNGLRALAMGNGSRSQLNLAYVPNNADIREGDLLVSSGMGGRFPPGYPVGTVSSVELDPALPYASITVNPTARLASSNEVLLIWPDGSDLDVPQVGTAED